MMFERFLLNGVEYQGHELTARQEIEIACHGAGRTEEAVTTFIRHAYTRTDAQSIEPWQLTAGQRYALIAVYLVQLENDGSLLLNQYEIGNGVAADYFCSYSECNFTSLLVDMGLFNGQTYTFKPLLGWHEDVVERVVRVIERSTTPEQRLPMHIYYELGMMAVQMNVSDERNVPDDSTQTQVACEIVKERIDILLSHSGADLSVFTALYEAALVQMPDVMKLAASPDGICVLPRDTRGGGDAWLSPVMFRPLSLLGENALRLGAYTQTDD
jgi:hypothetical protein